MRQTSLFELTETVGPRPLAAGAIERTPLAGGAWVDLGRSWMAAPGVLFDRLAAAVPWRAERRRMYERTVDVPRLLRFYGEGEPLPDGALVEARHLLSEHYDVELGEPLATVGLCLYRDGADSVAWHGDTIGRASRHDTVVAILSLGSPRRFLLRPARRGACPRRRPRLR